MALKIFFILFFVLGFQIFIFSQAAPKYYDKSFHIKIEPLHLFQAFPALGIGVEQKFSGRNLWASYHLGWEGLDSKKLSTYFVDNYTFHGIHIGYKKIYPSGTWESFLGLEFRFDHAGVDIANGVFYDIDGNYAMLYDEARYQRNRLGLFITRGYELLTWKRFSFEFYFGAGVGYVKNNYKDVVNPFLLADVPPQSIRPKKHHQYVDSFWRMALIGGLKVGYRI